MLDDSKLGLTYNKIASCHFRMKNYKRRNITFVYLNLGKCYQSQNNYDDALRNYHEGLSLPSENQPMTLAEKNIFIQLCQRLNLQTGIEGRCGGCRCRGGTSGRSGRSCAGGCGRGRGSDRGSGCGGDRGSDCGGRSGCSGHGGSRSGLGCGGSGRGSGCRRN
ncbi:unnamed protein product [Rotaria sp. Silwood1]|nr:unnamed protein product [Rotaria sp. Silwood1]